MFERKGGGEVAVEVEGDDSHARRRRDVRTRDGACARNGARDGARGERAVVGHSGHVRCRGGGSEPIHDDIHDDDRPTGCCQCCRLRALVGDPLRRRLQLAAARPKALDAEIGVARRVHHHARRRDPTPEASLLFEDARSLLVRRDVEHRKLVHAYKEQPTPAVGRCTRRVLAQQSAQLVIRHPRPTIVARLTPRATGEAGHVGGDVCLAPLAHCPHGRVHPRQHGLRVAHRTHELLDEHIIIVR